MAKYIHYHKLDEFAREYDYDILSLSTNYFLAYDKIQNNYSVVHFVMMLDEFCINMEEEPVICADLDSCILTYGKLITKELFS